MKKNKKQPEKKKKLTSSETKKQSDILSISDIHKIVGGVAGEWTPNFCITNHTNFTL